LFATKVKGVMPRKKVPDDEAAAEATISAFKSALFPDRCLRRVARLGDDAAQWFGEGARFVDITAYVNAHFHVKVNSYTYAKFWRRIARYLRIMAGVPDTLDDAVFLANVVVSMNVVEFVNTLLPYFRGFVKCSRCPRGFIVSVQTTGQELSVECDKCHARVGMPPCVERAFQPRDLVTFLSCLQKITGPATEMLVFPSTTGGPTAPPVSVSFHCDAQYTPDGAPPPEIPDTGYGRCFAIYLPALHPYTAAASSLSKFKSA